MKLVSCYIENFGMYSQQSFSFSAGLSVFCQDNGSGKSTLAAFLLAMLYGMESYRSTAKDLPTRLHYAPFQGGRYGGWLSFETEGRVYKIERFFDEKSETRDKVALYDQNNSPSQDLPLGTGEPGRTLFGLDEAGVRRLLFVSDSIAGFEGANMGDRLNQLAENAGNETSLNAALDDLSKKHKSIKADRGKSGAFWDCTFDRDRRANEIRDLKSKEARLEELYVLSQEKDEELKAQDQAIRAAEEAGRIGACFQTYDSYIAEAQKAAAIRQHTVLPDPALVKKLETLSSEETALKDRLSHPAFPPEKEEELAALSRRFASGLPSEDAIRDARANQARLAALHHERTALSAPLSPEEEALARRFAAGAPGEETVRSMHLLQKSLAETKQALDKSLDEIPEEEDTAAPASLLFRLLLVFGPLATAVGAVFCWFFWPVGIVLLAAGLGLCAWAVILKQRNEAARKRARLDRAAQITEQRRAWQQSAAKIEADLRMSLARYGYDGGDGRAVDADFYAFEQDQKAYAALAKKQKEQSERLQAIEQEEEERRRQLAQFLKAYALDEESDPFEQLRVYLETYRRLGEEKKKAVENRRCDENRLDALYSEARRALSPWQLEKLPLCDALAFLRDLIQTHERACDNEQTFTQKAEECRQTYGLDQKTRPTSLPTSEEIDGMKARREAAGAEKSRLWQEIEKAEAARARLPELLHEQDEAEEKLKDLQKKYDLLVKTEELLKAADKKLKERYLAPIKDRFVNYASLLEEALGEKVTVSPTLAVSYERGGALRSERYLSDGERSLCMLCLRLSLIDNIFPDDPPFLLLDDPFAALDAAHFARAAALLRSLSEKKQILYFTCHKSRCPLPDSAG